MYAIAFDLKIDTLKDAYGEPYNGAYAEIQRELEDLGFTWAQGSLYLTDEGNELVAVFNAIERLRQIDWFCKSVRDIRAFKVESWSDFTPKFKE
ncbi:virulence protein [Gordonibacter sp.]|nr:virulence protein [Gordonibacter sp.]HIW76720.1 virulence protein [Candidatus Gordonibacter avicola]